MALFFMNEEERFYHRVGRDSHYHQDCHKHHLLHNYYLLFFKVRQFVSCFHYYDVIKGAKGLGLFLKVMVDFPIYEAGFPLKRMFLC